MKTAHIFIGGFVQGVGFRHFLRSKANSLKLMGYVRNLPDGRVEALVQGDKSSVEKLIKECNKGPFLSNVEEVDVQWEQAIDKFKDFVIR